MPSPDQDIIRPQPDAETPVSFRSILRIRNYRHFYLSRTISLFGDILHSIAIIAFIYTRTHSAAALGAALFSLMIPRVVFSFISGILVDTWDRKRIMILADLYRCIAVVCIPFIQSIPLLYLILMTVSAAESCYNISRAATLPDILIREGELLQGNALSQTTSTVLHIGGPAVAGWLVVTMGAAFVFFIDSATYLIGAILLAGVSLHSTPRKKEKMSVRHIIDQVKDGFSLILFNNSLFSITLIYQMVVCAIFLTTSLKIVFADLFLSDQGYNPTLVFSYIGSVSAIGSIAAGLVLSKLSNRLSPNKLIAAGIFLTSVDLFCFAFSDSFPLILTAVAISGFGFVAASVSLFTRFQLYIDAENRGRIIAFFNIIMVTVSALSVSFGGWVSEYIGVRAVYGIAAMICLITASATFYLPGLKK